MPSGEIRRRKNATNRQTAVPSNSMSSEATPMTQIKRTHPSTTDTTGETYPTQSGTNSLKRREYDEYAWFAVFLLAASYFVITRRGGGIHHSRGGLLSSFSQPYQISASSVSVKENNEEALRSIFYIAKHQKDSTTSSLQLAHNHQLEVVLSSPPDLYCTEETIDKCNTNDNHEEECEKQSSNEQSTIPFLSHLISTTWVHDEDLGRGYLLLADGGRSGRIWRWEVGGGPITIGRSLHMERSGCRSGLWVDNGEDTKMKNGTTSCPDNIFSGSVTSFCSKAEWEQRTTTSPPLLGSASLAVELTRDAERSSIGTNIVVAEWGERRIVRVEGETGARTPLVVLVPPPKHHHDDKVEIEDEGQEAAHESEEVSVLEWVRVRRPNHLTYTPFGDLLFSDNHDNVGIVYRLKEAVHVQPISAEQSRDAHGWEKSTIEDQADQNNIDILFQTDALIEGLALGSDYSMLYVLVASPVGKTIYRLSLDSDEDGEDGDAPGDEANKGEGVGASVFYIMSYVDCEEDQLVYNGYASSSVGSKLAVDAQGNLHAITCSSTITLLSQEQGKVIGTLTSRGTESFTSIGFGEDGYLYITSPNELRRIKTRIGGVTLPTNLVVPRSANSATAA